MTPILMILGTGACSSLFLKRSVYTDWYTQRKLLRDPGVTSPAKQAARVDGVLVIKFRIGRESTVFFLSSSASRNCGMLMSRSNCVSSSRIPSWYLLSRKV